MATLTDRLTERAIPRVRAQLDHPTVRGIARGDLDPGVFRSWLEQDYLFLLDYARVAARLAWRAPTTHLIDLVDLAYDTLHDELTLHRSLAADFGADLTGTVAGPVTRAYTGYLLGAADDYGRGLAALLPCLWGYSTLGGLLAEDPPTEPRYARWVTTYADPGFAERAELVRNMLDEAHRDGLVDEPTATEAFDRSMTHEMAFWSTP